MAYTKLSRKHIIRHHIRRITTSEYYRVLVLRTIGNFLLFASLFLIVKTFWVPVQEELTYFINVQVQKKYIVADNLAEAQKFNLSENNQAGGLLAKAFNIKPIEVLAPQDPDFSIIIPKIGANSRIIPNVDASDETAYLAALKKGVAQVAGTAFPGEDGHIFLFAHSTDYFWNVSAYNAIFYLLYKLEKNDEVDLFYKGQRFVYKVIGSQIVDRSEIQYLTRKTNREFLTLQTCWPPGTTLKRLLIFAVRQVE